MIQYTKFSWPIAESIQETDQTIKLKTDQLTMK